MSSGAADEQRIGAVQGVKPPGIRELTPRADHLRPGGRRGHGRLLPVHGAEARLRAERLGGRRVLRLPGARHSRSSNYNRWENNIVQTAGTAAAQTAFMCVLLAAFDMLAASPDGLVRHRAQPAAVVSRG